MRPSRRPATSAEGSAGAVTLTLFSLVKPVTAFELCNQNSRCSSDSLAVPWQCAVLLSGDVVRMYVSVCLYLSACCELPRIFYWFRCIFAVVRIDSFWGRAALHSR